MVSEHISDTLVDISTQWSIDDAADAHDILDYFEALQEEHSRKK